MIDYIRCHYVSADSIQCESWHSRADGDMCPVHRGIVSTVLASNGHSKDEYISARKAAEVSLREKIHGLNAQEQCNVIDAHIAGIEKIIEEQKTLALTARAIRSEVIEGMSETDRQLRRLMKVPRAEKSDKPRKQKISGTPQEMLAKFMSQNPKMSESVARELLGLD